MDVDDLLPFLPSKNLFLRPIYKVGVVVHLPKMRPLNQSVSNWEIRERLKKMMRPIELSEFRVLESGVEEVKFSASLRSMQDVQHVIDTLDNVTFRAIGFTEPLSITIHRVQPDFPTRVDWDAFFHENKKKMDEKEPGERPDTLYLGGLPFDWFQGPSTNLEKIFKQIFSEYGEVSCVDIPQCDQFRRQMDNDISGVQLSSFNYGEDLFFEVYVQFKHYNAFVAAMSALGGKNLVRRSEDGELNETHIKLDFDRTAHLSIRKITQRSLRRACIAYENDQKVLRELSRSNKLEELIEEEKQKREKEEHEKIARRLMRLEKRKIIEEQKSNEHTMRKKLEEKLLDKLKQAEEERRLGAETLLAYIAKLYREKQQQKRATNMSIFDLASEYVKETGLPSEDLIRKRMIEKAELKLRSRMTERLFTKAQDKYHYSGSSSSRYRGK